MEPNELAEFIKKAGKTQRVIEFECPFVEDFHVQIAYANKFTMNQIYDAARETKVDYRTQVPNDRLNREKLRAAYAEQLTLGWKGLTVAKLQEIIPGLRVDLTREKMLKLFSKLTPEITAAKDDAALQKVIEKVEVPFDVLLSIAMLEVSLEFENWILFTATEIKNYSVIGEKKKAEIENLK